MTGVSFGGGVEFGGEGAYILARDYVVGNGIANDTAGMLAFFNACITQKQSGYIGPGTYLINEGVLAFDNGFVDKPFPNIYTAGHDAVIFKGANFANAAILSFTNGTATSGVGQYWRGGYLGGISFLGANTGSSAHGLSVRGMWGVKFGWMRGDSLGGAVVYLPPLLYSGTNPDPYAVSSADFEAIEAHTCNYTLYNANYLGMDGWHVSNLFGYNNAAGFWYGTGSGCRIDNIAAGNCAGWAFDDGTNVDATGGPPSRLYIGNGELDNVQNGFRLNRTTFFDIRGVRFIHRYNSGLNVATNYWPRTALDIDGGASPATASGTIQLFHRIEAGGVKANMGVFINTHSDGNVSNLKIDQKVIDNAGFGFADSDLYSNTNNTIMTLYRDGKRILDNSDRMLSYGRGSASTTVPNSGFTTTAARIAFPTQVYTTPSTVYDTATSTYTAPMKGLHRIEVSVPLTLAAGTRVRMALMLSGSASVASYLYAATAAVQTYEYNKTVLLNAGDTVYVTMDQNTASATVAAAPQLTNDECRFVVVPI